MDKKGFTFIEIIISFALLSIISVITLTLFSSTYLNVIYFGDMSEDVVAGQDVVESILLKNVYEASEDGPVPENPDGESLSMQFESEGNVRGGITGKYYKVIEGRSDLEIFVAD